MRLKSLTFWDKFDILSGKRLGGVKAGPGYVPLFFRVGGFCA